MLRKTLIACAVHTSGPTRDAGRCILQVHPGPPPPPQAHRSSYSYRRLQPFSYTRVSNASRARRERASRLPVRTVVPLHPSRPSYQPPRGSRDHEYMTSLAPLLIPRGVIVHALGSS